MSNIYPSVSGTSVSPPYGLPPPATLRGTKSQMNFRKKSARCFIPKKRPVFENERVGLPKIWVTKNMVKLDPTKKCIKVSEEID
jgi:hypothetical protein